MRLEKSGTSKIGPGGLKRLRRSKNCGSLRFDFFGYQSFSWPVVR
jgi:hypothetical protein